MTDHSINVMDPLDLLPQPQQEAARKLRHFIRALEKIRPPSKNSDLFVGEIDQRGIARVQMFARDGLRSVETIVIEVPMLHTDYRQFAMRLANEYAELHKALFLKTFAPDLYNDGMSPVVLKESKTVKSMDLT